MAIGVQLTDGMMLRLVFTTHPASKQAGQDCSSLSRDINLVGHPSPWLPHLNLLNVLRSWQFAMLLKYHQRCTRVLMLVHVGVLDALCFLMSISRSNVHLKIM